MAYIWFCVFIVALIVEAMSDQLVSVWFAIGSVAAIIGYYCGAPLWLQLILCAVFAVLPLFLLRPYVQKVLKHKSPYAETGKDIIGQTGTIVEAIATNQGRVLLHGVYWRAKTADGSEIPEDALVTVEDRTGTTLVVKLLNEKESI